MVPQSQRHKRRCCSTKCSGKYKTQKYLDAVKNQTEKKCYRCHKVLPLDQFTKHSQKPDGLFPYCKTCHTKMNQKWIENNREYVRERTRNYMRKHRIGQSSIDFRNVKNKRNYPINNKCELCSETVRLIYHHWNDNDFSKGIWICRKCHFACHWLEKYDSNIYFDLKNQITSSTSL